ncbi:glycine oxidase ThiO [Nesterenkonia sp.]|uniref:glycine oxidase ThiO n=1 Tax=Nesterenkonia sp. TaxID=704201 RepID=UPI00260E9313|nr:glycine oxidase ThiO [Nesterenkonia sp.]
MDSLSVPKSASTVVVGAGVVGLASAWQLRRAGHAVTVIDPAPGKDASYAAAGMLAPISEVQYGQQQLWDLMTASRAEYPDFIDSLRAAVQEPTGYRENGTILVAADPSDRDSVTALVDLQTRHGMDVHPLTGTALRRREPSLTPGLAKAWDIPGDHQVDPRLLVRSLTAALGAEPRRVGPGAGPPAQWMTAAVTAVEPAPGGGGQLTLQDGTTLQAERILLSPGLGYAQIAGLPQHHRLDLRPVHGDVLRLRVRPEQLLQGEEHVLHATVRATVAGRSVYLVPRADGGLVIGASSREDGLAGTHAGSVAELLQDAIAVLPAVREMHLEEITTRARPGTPDDRPYLDQLAEGIVVSTGFHRHGILLAPLAARLSAALLEGRQLGVSDAASLESMRCSRP